jgi:mevalonate kinase
MQRLVPVSRALSQSGATPAQETLPPPATVVQAAAASVAQEQNSGGDTRAYGKLILFGEHFVVYDVPAIVAAISSYTDCDFKWVDEPGLEVLDERPAVPLYKQKKAEEGEEAIRIVLRHFGIDTAARGVRLRFGGDLTCVSGIGASAAQVVSLSRAIGWATGLALSEQEVNAAGYEGEKGYHGTPSGIDNTASTYGGVLRFRRTAIPGAPEFAVKRLSEGARIVYASTGITASTSEVVGDVARRREAEPEWFQALLERYACLVEQGEAALDACNWVKLGALLDENHALCDELGVSCPELERLVLAARAAGALGAKLSGTGRGGLMLALIGGPEAEAAQAKVARALEEAGATQVWTTTFA